MSYAPFAYIMHSRINMNKKLPLLLSTLCLVTIMSILGFSKPSISSGWLIVTFFILYFGFIFFGLQSIGYLLGINSKKTKKISFIAACIVVSAQILITFQALRPIELILISSVLGITGWYISRAKS